MLEYGQPEGRIAPSDLLVVALRASPLGNDGKTTKRKQSPIRASGNDTGGENPDSRRLEVTSDFMKLSKRASLLKKSAEKGLLSQPTMETRAARILTTSVVKRRKPESTAFAGASGLKTAKVGTVPVLFFPASGGEPADRTRNPFNSK